MQPTTALLISSPHAHWVGLQAMLCKLRQMHVIGEAQRREETVRIAAAEQPDIIFVGSDLPGLPVVPLVQEVREVSPTSQVVVVGKLLDRMDDIYLGCLGVTVVAWRDVTEGTLRVIVEAMQADLCAAHTTNSTRRALLNRQRGSLLCRRAAACQGRVRPCAHS